MNLSPSQPSKFVHIGGIKDQEVLAAFRNIVRILEVMQQDIAMVINTNELVQISQATQPTPDEGEWFMWLNTSGTATEAKARIVTKQEGSVYSFKSAEVY